MIEEQKGVIADWDSRQLCHQRLHSALVNASRCAVSDLFVGWSKYLDEAYKEVCPYIDPPEEKDCEEQRKKVREERKKYIEDTNLKKKNRNHNIETKLPLLLDKFEITIRKYAHKHKLLIPERTSAFDDEDDDI